MMYYCTQIKTQDTNNELGVPVYVGMEYSELARGLVENKVVPLGDGMSAEAVPK